MGEETSNNSTHHFRQCDTPSEATYLFRGGGVWATVLAEKQQYDPWVVVKFNPKAYANSSNMVEWLDE